MLREIVFLDTFQTWSGDIYVIARAQNRARVGGLHFQKHFIVVDENGAGFGGAIVNHDGDFSALDIGRQAVKTSCGAIEFSECAIERSRAVVLTSGGPSLDAGSRNDGG